MKIGDFVSNTHRIIHTGREKNESGVDLILDNGMNRLKWKPFNTAIIIVYAPTAHRIEEIDNFYNFLTKTLCKSQEITIIMGDLNANVEKEQDDEISWQLWMRILKQVW